MGKPAITNGQPVEQWGMVWHPGDLGQMLAKGFQASCVGTWGLFKEVGHEERQQFRSCPVREDVTGRVGVLSGSSAAVGF